MVVLDNFVRNGVIDELRSPPTIFKTNLSETGCLLTLPPRAKKSSYSIFSQRQLRPRRGGGSQPSRVVPCWTYRKGGKRTLTAREGGTGHHQPASIRISLAAYLLDSRVFLRQKRQSVEERRGAPPPPPPNETSSASDGNTRSQPLNLTAAAWKAVDFPDPLGPAKTIAPAPIIPCNAAALLRCWSCHCGTAVVFIGRQMYGTV